MVEAVGLDAGGQCLDGGHWTGWGVEVVAITARKMSHFLAPCGKAIKDPAAVDGLLWVCLQGLDYFYQCFHVISPPGPGRAREVRIHGNLDEVLWSVSLWVE